MDIARHALLCIVLVNGGMVREVEGVSARLLGRGKRKKGDMGKGRFM